MNEASSAIQRPFVEKLKILTPEEMQVRIRLRFSYLAKTKRKGQERRTLTRNRHFRRHSSVIQRDLRSQDSAAPNSQIEGNFSAAAVTPARSSRSPHLSSIERAGAKLTQLRGCNTELPTLQELFEDNQNMKKAISWSEMRRFRQRTTSVIFSKNQLIRREQIFCSIRCGEISHTSTGTLVSPLRRFRKKATCSCSPDFSFVFCSL